MLDNALNVVSPLGATVKLGKVCKDCTLTLEDKNLPIELIVLPMKEFDVILGFDWLTKYHAKLDCVSKTITFFEPGSVPFNFESNPSSDAFLTSRVAALKTTSSKVTISQISIV